MLNVIDTKYFVKSEDLQKVFQKYNIRLDHPINNEEFVKDVHQITNIVSTSIITTENNEYSFTKLPNK